MELYSTAALVILISITSVGGQRYRSRYERDRSIFTDSKVLSTPFGIMSTRSASRYPDLRNNIEYGNRYSSFNTRSSFRGTSSFRHPRRRWQDSSSSSSSEIETIERSRSMNRSKKGSKHTGNKQTMESRHASSESHEKRGHGGNSYNHHRHGEQWRRPSFFEMRYGRPYTRFNPVLYDTAARRRAKDRGTPTRGLSRALDKFLLPYFD